MSIRTNISPDFLKAFNRIIQQREVCDKIIADAKTFDQRAPKQSWNYSIGGGAYSYFASQAKDGSWTGSLSQGGVDDVSIKVKKADREAFEGSLGLADEFACQLAIDDQVLWVVLFAPVTKDTVHAGTFAYSFSFRLLTRQRGRAVMQRSVYSRELVVMLLYGYSLLATERHLPKNNRTKRRRGSLLSAF